VAIAGICGGGFSFTVRIFVASRSPLYFQGLQPGYLLTVLLFAGLLGGTALAILRWRVLLAQQQVRPSIRLLESSWSIYLHAASLWIASETVLSWLSGWSHRSFSVDWVIVAGGLLLIAPIPIVFPARAGSGRWKLIWKYSVILAVEIVVGFVILAAINITTGIFGVYLWVLFPLSLVIVWMACFPWVLLYGWSIPFPTGPSDSENAQAYRRPTRLAEWTIISITALGQIGTLFGGLLATTPVSLGFHGIGCVYVYPAKTAEYWFWMGYRGFSTEVIAGDQIILRPSVNRFACLSVPTQGMYETSSVEQGYLFAARSWFWLIDPEQWESKKTKQNRKELARFIGRDYSSYDDLRSWWEQNSETLVWYGKDELLEMPRDGWKRYPRVGFSYVEQVRLGGPVWLWEPDREPEVSGGYGAPIGDAVFSSAFVDREARLRGLKLYVDDSMEVLTGERQRRAHEFLLSITGEDWVTEAGWWDALNHIRRTNPWQMSHFDTQSLLHMIQMAKDAGRDARMLPLLKEKTGLSYENAEEYIPWLENPENARFADWQKATGLISDLCLEDRGAHNCPTGTVATLEKLTGKNFATPGEWLKWWHDHRTNAALSEDGRRLVTKNK
jgi:uncharacterized membrane protein